MQELGLAIHAHWSSQAIAKCGKEIPDIFIISLDRLPSHGRQYAQWIWEAKKRQHIPIIFVDGKPDKVEAMREKFPGAVYCSSGQLVTTIKKLVKGIQV